VPTTTCLFGHIYVLYTVLSLYPSLCLLSMNKREGPWIDLLVYLFFKNLVCITVVRIRVRTGSGSKQAKMTPRKRKVKKFQVLSAECSFWGLETSYIAWKSFMKA
jgi:hypothetical protein